MFSNIMKYHIIANIKQKDNFFWTLCFPFILATVLNITFCSLKSVEKITLYPVAVVDIDNSGKEIISKLESNSMIEVNITDKENADELLRKDKVVGVINIKDGEISLLVSNSSYEQSIIKSILEDIEQTSFMLTNLESINSGNTDENLMNFISSDNSYTRAVNINTNNDVYVVFFFSLIAMACLFSGMTSLYSVNNIQANQSTIGAKQSIIPEKKFIVFSANFTSDMISQYFSIILLVLYIKYVLKYNIGNINGWMLIFIFISLFASISFGAFLSAIVKLKVNIKSSILTAISLISCGISGFFSYEIKLIIEDKIPFIKYINPASLITDGLMALYYYNSYNMYFICIVILGIIGMLLFTGTCLVLRRQKYDSI